MPNCFRERREAPGFFHARPTVSPFMSRVGHRHSLVFTTDIGDPEEVRLSFDSDRCTSVPDSGAGTLTNQKYSSLVSPIDRSARAPRTNGPPGGRRTAKRPSESVLAVTRAGGRSSQ